MKTQPYSSYLGIGENIQHLMINHVKIVSIKYFQFFYVGWLVGVLWHVNHCRYFNANSIFIQIVLFQTIQFSMSTYFNSQKYFYFNLFSLVKQL